MITTASLPQTVCANPNSVPSDAIAIEEGTGDDFDTRTVEIRVIVYDDARFVLMDADGHVVIEIDAPGRERGRTAGETLNVQRVSIEIFHADNIEVFVKDLGDYCFVNSRSALHQSRQNILLPKALLPDSGEVDIR